MFEVAAVALVVGIVISFTTIGLLAFIQSLNQLLLVSAGSRANINSNTLAFTTVLSVSIGVLIVGLLLHYGVNSWQPLGVPDTIYTVQLCEKLPMMPAKLKCQRHWNRCWPVSLWLSSRYKCQRFWALVKTFWDLPAYKTIVAQPDLLNGDSIYRWAKQRLFATLPCIGVRRSTFALHRW